MDFGANIWYFYGCDAMWNDSDCGVLASIAKCALEFNNRHRINSGGSIMSAEADTDTMTYKVVIKHQEQYSI